MNREMNFPFKENWQTNKKTTPENKAKSHVCNIIRKTGENRKESKKKIPMYEEKGELYHNITMYGIE
jgi:hypothetical protein